MASALKTFVQQVIRIAAPSVDVGGAVIPSLSGVVNAGSDVIHDLHVRTIAFAQAYSRTETDEEELHEQARSVEAALMAAVTLGVLPGHDGARLIDELQALLEAKAMV